MPKHILWIALAGLLLINVVEIFTKTSEARSRSFAGVVPFMGATGRLGFFDQTTGALYLYDDNLTTCLYMGQLNELGQPCERLQQIPLTYQDELPDVQALKDKAIKQKTANEQK